MPVWPSHTVLASKLRGTVSLLAVTALYTVDMGKTCSLHACASAGSVNDFRVSLALFGTKRLPMQNWAKWSAPLASSQMVSGESSQYLTGMHRKCAKMTPMMTPFIV